MCPWPLRKIVMHGVTHDSAAPLPRERKTHVHAETRPARSWLHDLRRPRGGLSPDARQVTDGRPCFPGHRNNTDARSPGSPRTLCNPQRGQPSSAFPGSELRHRSLPLLPRGRLLSASLMRTPPLRAHSLASLALTNHICENSSST